jgi:hypothetical protein
MQRSPWQRQLAAAGGSAADECSICASLDQQRWLVAATNRSAQNDDFPYISSPHIVSYCRQVLLSVFCGNYCLPLLLLKARRKTEFSTTLSSSSN